MWEATQVHGGGPRRWAVWKLFAQSHYIVHRKGSGRERRFHTRFAAEKFAEKLNRRSTQQ